MYRASTGSQTTGAAEQHQSRYGQGTSQNSTVVKIKSETKFNVAAAPFVFPSGRITNNSLRNDDSPEVAFIGPTQLAVNKRVWSSISSYPLEEITNSRMFSTTPREFFDFYQSQQQRQSALPLPYEPAQQFGPIVLPNGIIQLQLRESVVVEMTMDRSIKLVNNLKNILIALSSDCSTSAVTHPNGVVFQHGAKVEIIAFDGRRNNNYIRYAKMWQKGISLTSEGCALIYLVDNAGTRTTSDMINIDMKTDYISQVFYHGTRCGAQNPREINNIVSNSSFCLGEDGTLIFTVNNVRITQTVDGLVKATRLPNGCTIRSSPTNGSTTITTPYIHCTASMGQTSHLFVRHEERRMHFDGASFVVRNAGHSAGFDECNRLRVY